MSSITLFLRHHFTHLGLAASAMSKPIPDNSDRTDGDRSNAAPSSVTGAWVQVHAARGRLPAWDAGRQEEVVLVQPAAEFVASCLRFLPDPFQQARLDLPRMSVRANGVAVRTIEQLLHLVEPHQGGAVAALCTQVIFGEVYERAMQMAAASGLHDLVVCEQHPSPRAAVVDLCVTPEDSRGMIFGCAGHRVLAGVVATKQMRAVAIDSGRECEVDFQVDLQCHPWGGAIFHVTHTPLRTPTGVPAVGRHT